MSDEHLTELALLIAIRDGLPDKCDFCERPYSEIEGRWPVPEEAGAWSCNKCEEKEK